MAPAVYLGIAAFALTAFALGRRPARARCPAAGGGTLEGVRYLEHNPPGLENARLPMLIVLHGRGSRPSGVFGMARGAAGGVRVIAPEGIEPFGKVRAWFQSRSVDPEFNDQVRAAARRIAPFLRAIQACRPTVGKPVIAGHSQGAHMSYIMARLYPNLIRSAVAGSGYLPESLWARFDVPVAAIHGTADATVPFARTATMVANTGASFHPVSGGHALSGQLKSLWLRKIQEQLAQEVA